MVRGKPAGQLRLQSDEVRRAYGMEQSGLIDEFVNCLSIEDRDETACLASAAQEEKLWLDWLEDFWTRSIREQFEALEHSFVRPRGRYTESGK